MLKCVSTNVEDSKHCTLKPFSHVSQVCFLLFLSCIHFCNRTLTRSVNGLLKIFYGFTLAASLLLRCVPLKLVVILEKSKLTSPLGSLYTEYIWISVCKVHIQYKSKTYSYWWKYANVQNSKWQFKQTHHVCGSDSYSTTGHAVYQLQKYVVTFGTKIIASSTVAVSRETIPVTAYWVVGWFWSIKVVGMRAMAEITRVYTQKTMIFESLSSLTLTLRVSKAKIRLKTSSTALYTRRMGIQIWLVSEKHKVTSCGSSP